MTEETVVVIFPSNKYLSTLMTKVSKITKNRHSSVVKSKESMNQYICKPVFTVKHTLLKVLLN